MRLVAEQGLLLHHASAHRVVVLLGGHVGVPVAPVEVDLLLLLVVEPHQLLGGGAHEAVQRLQVPQARLGRVLEHAVDS